MEFFELSPAGELISEGKEIELNGDVYIDNWVIKFDDKYVEQGDVERYVSGALRRIFSENQQPNEGVLVRPSWHATTSLRSGWCDLISKSVCGATFGSLLTTRRKLLR